MVDWYFLLLGFPAPLAHTRCWIDPLLLSAGIHVPSQTAINTPLYSTVQTFFSPYLWVYSVLQYSTASHLATKQPCNTLNLVTPPRALDLIL